jgi:hypothetical protein
MLSFFNQEWAQKYGDVIEVKDAKLTTIFTPGHYRDNR